MAGSVFGKNFIVSTFGESHGAALGCIIDGCPAGLKLSEDDIQKYLDRRKPGTSAMTTSRKEADKAEILSGVYEGITEGTPIAVIIRNTSQHSSDYDNLKDTFRPGHADLCFYEKYGTRDHRGGGRSSGRETAARVAAGAVAQKILKELGINIYAVTASLGDIKMTPKELSSLDDEALKSALTRSTVMPDERLSMLAEEMIKKYRAENDSAGGSVYIRIEGMPAGIGEPVFDKLDAMLAKALFSIGAVKAVETGAGIHAADLKGSENNDNIRIDEGHICFDTNNSGGILGGMSNGDRIELRAWFKPTPSIFKPQNTIKKLPDGSFEETVLSIEGRHDPVVVPRAVVVCECMTAITILDALMSNVNSRMENLKKIYNKNTD